MANHIGVMFPAVTNAKWSGAPAWLNAPVVHNYDSVGVEASFGFVGTHASTQPVTENPVGHNGSRLPGFGDDFYNRILIEPSVIDAGNLISEQLHEVSVFNGYFTSKTLQSLVFDDSVGVNLSGAAVGSVWGQLETKTYQLTVRMEGPPTINASLAFDWDGIADDRNIAISGVRIVMLPYQAATPWKESLEWKTNVLETNNGTEQRIRLRKAPRQYIDAQYPIDNAHMAKSVNMLNGWVGKRWALGMWSETQHIGAVANGSNTIYCDTTKADYRADGMLLIWDSADNNEALEIATVTPTQINLKRVTVGSYANAIVMPVRMAVTKGGTIGRSSSGYNSQLSISYSVTDNAIVTPDVPEQYLNEDVYWDVSLIGDSDMFSEQIKTRQDEVDYATGAVDYFSPWKNSKRARNVSFLNDGPNECWIFKKWLNRRAGRLRPYWLPTFEENLRVSQVGQVTSFITVLDDNYKNLGKAHDHIAIQLDDYTWHPRKVTGIADASIGRINIAIDSPLFVDATRIRLISFLTLHRLDTDLVDIDWIGNSINTCSLRILEIKL